MKDDAVLFIRWQLPAVRRVRFPDVYKQKSGAVLVLIVETFEVASLATERRSRVAAEDQYHGPVALYAASGDGTLPVERIEREVRGDFTDFRGAPCHEPSGLFPIGGAFVRRKAFHVFHECIGRILRTTSDKPG